MKSIYKFNKNIHLVEIEKTNDVDCLMIYRYKSNQRRVTKLQDQVQEFRHMLPLNQWAMNQLGFHWSGYLQWYMEATNTWA